MATENNNRAPAFLDREFAPEDYLPLPPAIPLEQSTLLDEGKILTASVDPESGTFILARHLKSGWLDPGFGLYGVQRIASDIARSVNSLTLRLEANGRVVVQGRLSDPITGRRGIYLLRVLPSAQAQPCLGVDAFLILSLLPTASTAPNPVGGVDEWTWLRWPSPQIQ
ncbi:hypothetical protein B8W70_02185 [Pseudomonas sp. 1239]|uniref:hypothetical protein n=1 Tax=Pseudomonas TaxID=286 RepID=UPI0005C1F5E0|nr:MULTISPECIES: hypothetical protein [Pseudomonas]KIU52276.1 hypothetical protein QV12_09305 [Pseudomonas putida]OUM35494.1 hypothetical protein B8W70_02185 [Pseudomonas sp. 1239]WKL66519.1 hypothetical protein Q1Z72_25060 [Pseudomonas qingdaonensis]